MNRQEIQNLTKEILEKMNLSVQNISFAEEEGLSIVWLKIDMSEPHLFTSRGAEALAALNHLVKRMIETKQDPDEPMNILIDINDFQKKRIDTIKATAHMMAERAKYFKSSVEVDPMSAFDRRIVHEFLANATDLKTESIGEGFSRRVVIKYTGSI